MALTKKEIVKWIKENCTSEDGKTIDLSNMDFSDFDGTINRSGWITNGNLLQGKNKVKGDLEQTGNYVYGDFKSGLTRTSMGVWGYDGFINHDNFFKEFRNLTSTFDKELDAIEASWKKHWDKIWNPSLEQKDAAKEESKEKIEK